MTAVTAPPTSPPPFPVARAFGLVVVPLVIAYAMTLRWIFDSWMLPDSYWSHGPLLPVLAAFVVWRRRTTWRAAPIEPGGRLGTVLLALGLGVHLVGAATMIDSLSATSLLLTVPGACLVLFGRARMRSLWPVVGLLPFALPLPMAVSGDLAFELKEIAVGLGLGIANLLGAGAERVGAEIVVPGQTIRLLVADPCSGLRSLVALTTLGYCVAFFLGPLRGARPWVLLAAAVPLAVLTNVLRIAGIVVLGRVVDVPFAAGTGHDVLNAVAWLVDLAALLALDALLTRRRRA